MERYKSEIVVSPDMCYRNGAMRLEAWFAWFQRGGTEHLERMEAGGGGLPKNLAWVLLEVKAKIRGIRKAGEKLFLETFPIKGTSALFPRRYVCRGGEGGDGSLVTTADTTWALMDVVRRRMTRSDVITEKLLPFEEIDESIQLLTPLDEFAAALPTKPQMKAFTPEPTDFDANGHVNNTRYIAWLGDSLYKLGGLAQEIHCRYHAEILPGQEALLALRECAGKFFCEIFSRAEGGDKLCFAAAGLLR